MPALADSRLAAVRINTRLPLGRLVDWADQAVLMVVLSSGNEEKLDERIRHLRTFGVRGASDFLGICGSGREDSVEALDRILASTSEDPSAVLMSSTDVCDAIHRQRVIVDVLQWRSSPLALVDQAWIELPPLKYETLESAVART